MRQSRTTYESISELPIWVGVLGGPIIWGLHLGVGYTLVSLPCIVDFELPRSALYATTAVAALAALACVASAGAVWRRSGLQIQGDWAESGGRKGFMAALGVLFSGVSLIAIVVQSFALPFVSYC